MGKTTILTAALLVSGLLSLSAEEKWDKTRIKNPYFSENRKYSKPSSAKTIFRLDTEQKKGEKLLIPDFWNIHKGGYLESYKGAKGVISVPGSANLKEYTKIWQIVELPKNKYKLVKVTIRYRHEKLRARDSRDEENKYREGRLIISFQDKDGKMIWPLGQQGAYSQPIPSFDKWNLNTYSINIPKGAVSFQVIFCAMDPQNKLFIDGVKLKLLTGTSSELHPEKKVEKKK